MKKQEKLISIDPLPFKEDEKQKKTDIPIPIRGLITGPSNSGKTHLVFNLIWKGLIPFSKLYIYSKTVETDKTYTLLKQIYNEIEDEEGKPIAFFSNDFKNIIPYNECEKDALFIFDDCILEKQSPIQYYFTMGRHKNISCIYLTQCYGKVDLQLIRTNLNYLFIFQQGSHYIQKIYNDFVSFDMKFEDFIELCRNRWKKEFGFLTINVHDKNNKYEQIFA